MRKLGKRGQEGPSVGGTLVGVLLIIAVAVVLLIGLGFATGHGWKWWEMFTGGTVNIGVVAQACLSHCTNVAQLSEAQAKNLYCYNPQDVVFLDKEGDKDKTSLKDVSCWEIVEWQAGSQNVDNIDLGFSLDDELKDCDVLHALCPQAQAGAGASSGVATTGSCEVEGNINSICDAINNENCNAALGCKLSEEDCVANTLECNTISTNKALCDIEGDGCVWEVSSA